MSVGNVGIKQRVVGGYGIRAKEWRELNNFFLKLFWNFPSGGGRNSSRRAHHLGERQRKRQ
jgi:hypothetical protein